MLIVKQNPKGIDKPIGKFQQRIYDNLLIKYPSIKYQSYPRCYKNFTSNGIVPEFSLDKKDYKTLLFDDRVDIQSFFIRDDSTIFENGNNKSHVSLIVSADLVKIYPLETQRADERLRLDLVEVMSAFSFGFNLKEIIEGVDNVYKEFKKDNLKLSDIQPRHVLRFEFEINYKSDNCDC
jgi:hypothetical protein